MLSYWEKQSLLNYDVIVVGSGIVGLSTAISIREKQPNATVVVLERAILPTGASTKNAGFACVGSLTEILDDLQNMTENEVLQLVEMRAKGLKRLRKRLGDTAIGYAENGSYELISSEEESCLDEMDKINALLKPVLCTDAYKVSDKKISSFGLSRRHTKHLVTNVCEGELHTGKMMRALIDLCISKGVEIKTGCEVLSVDETHSCVSVLANHSWLQEQIVFIASQVVICTNAFTKQLFAETDIDPGRGQVLITKPITGLKLKGIFHFQKGYYYFREVEGRVLFGGGRNLDFEGERTSVFAFNEKIRADLTDKLQQIVLSGTPFEIDSWWTGIMAFGKSKFPIAVQQSSRTFVCARMGGMGVAIGSEIGEKMGEMVRENL